MTTDLTTGKTHILLIKYSLPILLSVAFQQLYNIADSIIVGKFAGESSLAAIGVSYPITMIFMAVAFGCNNGCSIVISQLFGAKRYTDVKTAITTTFITVGILSVILTVLGLFSTPLILQLIDTPANIFEEGALYLNIFIVGLIFMYMYNISNGVFTALGDSKTPLIFLIISSIANVLLDLLFVAVFHWGIGGAAWATFIAQGFSCFLSLITLRKRIKEIKTDEKAKRFTLAMFKHIMRMTIPSVLQQCFISFGNVFIQGLVNGFGSAAVAGYSAAIKLNVFAVTSFSALSSGISGFTAQNIGAEKPKRVKTGLKTGFVIVFALALVYFATYFFFSREMVSIFVESPTAKALETGIAFLSIVSPCYLLVGIKLACDGVLRGTGSMKSFMLSTFTDLIIRVACSYILVPFIGINGIFVAWIVGWLLGMVIAIFLTRQKLQYQHI